MKKHHGEQPEKLPSPAFALSIASAGCGVDGFQRDALCMHESATHESVAISEDMVSGSKFMLEIDAVQ